MSDNNVKIDYSSIKFPPSSIRADELERLQRLDANVQEQIKRYKNYIYEADQLIKHARTVNTEWLMLSILAFEEKIRNLESLY
jgi:hypothetical protein